MGSSGRSNALPASAEARLAALEQTLAARTQGVGTVSAGLAGGTIGTATITYDKPMPDTNYKVVSVALEGASGVSGVLTPILPVTEPTTTGCKVGVKNNALLALAVTATVRVTVEKF